MSTEKDYLKDLFINEVKGCLAGEGLSEDEMQVIINAVTANIGTNFDEIVEKANNALNISELAKTVADTALSIAKGRATAYVFDTVELLDEELTKEEFVANLVVGDNFYIRALDVPDYWWDGEQKQQLETEKPNITNVIEDVLVNGVTAVTDGVANIGIASKTRLGVVGINEYWGIDAHSNGNLKIVAASSSDINSRNTFKPITPSIMEYAVMEALSNTMADIWTEERMTAARSRLGIAEHKVVRL